MNAQWLLYGTCALLAMLVAHVILPGVVSGPGEVVVAVLRIAGGGR